MQYHLSFSSNRLTVPTPGYGKNSNGTNGNGNNGYGKNCKGNNGNMQNMEEMANFFIL